MFNVPILMLHAIGSFDDPSKRLMAISEAQLVQLLDIIEAQNLQTITFADLRQNPKLSTKKKVIISFDDCYTHLLDFAVPELRRRKMNAVFYAPVAHLGLSNSWDQEGHETAHLEIMTTDQLKQLQNWGMEIGSHGFKHVDLTQIEPICRLESVSRSKMELEKHLKTEVVSFAWPYGKVPKTYRILMRKAGYHYGVCIYRAFQNPLTLRRIGIHPADTASSISRKLTPTYRFLRRFLDLRLSFRS